MKKVTIFKTALVIFAGLSIASCSKDDEGTSVNSTELQTTILAQTTSNVITAAYADMHASAVNLNVAIGALVDTPTEAELTQAREMWKAVRSTWEKSEAFLFGPIASKNIDPRIDSWPIDMNGVQTILSGSKELTQEYINTLSDNEKGFHPIEFLLWGENGDKTAANFTPREEKYLLALGQNLEALAKAVNDSWQNDYTSVFVSAGDGSSIYSSREEALIQLVNGMAGICDEVANGKIAGPFDLQDPTQLESPFSQNSVIDFTNNIKGVMAVYQGKLFEDGKGLEDFVRNHNLQLDNKIKTAHAAAIQSLEVFDINFGKAIIEQPNKVQNTIDKINALKNVLETELLPLVKKYGK